MEELHGLGRENGSRFKQNKTIKQGKFIRKLSLHLKQNNITKQSYNMQTTKTNIQINI